MRIRTKQLLGIAAGGAVIVAGLIWLAQADRGTQPDRRSRPTSASPTAPEAARPVVERYLEALRRRDRSALMRLAPPGYDAERDIENRIAVYGGVRAEGARIVLTADIAPEVVTARINAIDSEGKPLRWTENLVWKRNWFLLLGSDKNGGGAGPPSDTGRP